MQNSISWTAYVKQLGEEQEALMSAEFSRREEVKKGLIETADIPVFTPAISTDDDAIDHEYFAEIGEFDHSTGETIKPTGYSLSENQVKKYAEFNVNALKSRGWTRAMIKKHLGEPDRHDSGRGSRGHTMSLYKKTRVFETEAKEGWKKDAERAKARSAIGKKAWEEGGKKVWEKKKAALKESEKKFWDVSCFTPESVQKIYEEQLEKDRQDRQQLMKKNHETYLKEYPEYDKARASEVAEMLYEHKKESQGGWLEHSTRRFIYAKILKHISGDITDLWGPGVDPYDYLSKGDGFPAYAPEPSKLGIPVDEWVMDESEQALTEDDMPF